MTQKQFFAQRQKKSKMQAFEIYHPAIGYVRYVGGQFYSKTLTMRDGSRVSFEPAQLKFSLPSMSEYNTLSMKVELGRVGTMVKEKLRAIEEYNLANPNTTTTDFRYFNFIDGVETYRIEMWVKDVILDDQFAAIIASDDNPAAINVAERYEVERFPGLAVPS